MRRAVIKGAAAGMMVSGMAYAIVKIMGYSWTSLTLLLYLYVFLGIIMALASKLEILDRGFSGLLDRLVLVVEEEELKIRKVFTGETYRLDGEIEKL